MNLTSQEVILFLLAQLGTAAAIWGGIRADIRNMKEQIRAAGEVAGDAHDRIDSIMNANYHDMHLNRRMHGRRESDPQP